MFNNNNLFILFSTLLFWQKNIRERKYKYLHSNVIVKILWKKILNAIIINNGLSGFSSYAHSILFSINNTIRVSFHMQDSVVIDTHWLVQLHPQLTPSSRILPEQLTGRQLFKEIPKL